MYANTLVASCKLKDTVFMHDENMVETNAAQLQIICCLHPVIKGLKEKSKVFKYAK